MKKWIKTTLNIGISVIVGFGCGISILFLVKKFNGNINNIERGKLATKIERNYKENKNVELVEYEYNGNSFLGSEGLNLLNKKINESLPFGSEISQLKNITFNDTYQLPSDIGKINGQYNSYTMEMDIDLRGIMLDRQNWDSSIEQRVDYVYSIVLHEYGHHLANTYINSIRLDNSQNYNRNVSNINKLLLESSKKANVYILKNVPINFWKTWTESLNYFNNELQIKEKELLLSNLKINNIPYVGFNDNELVPSDEVILYTSGNIFEAANFPLSSNNYNDFLSKNNIYKNAIVSFNNEKTIWTSFSINNLTSYNYGIDELLTRQLVSFSYIPSEPNSYIFFNYKNSLLINPFAPDVLLRNNVFVNKSLDSNIDYQYINTFSADNIWGWKDENGKLINDNHISLRDSYRNVFGYGKLISQIYYDNSNNMYVDSYRQTLKSDDFNKIQIGGYLPKNSTIKGLILKTKNNEKKLIKFENIFKSRNLQAKNSPFSLNYDNDQDLYDQYISETINLNEMNFEDIEEIKYWDDSNNDQEINNNEIKDIKKDQIVLERSITTFRSSLETYYIDYDKKIHKSTFNDSRNNNVYTLKFDNEKKLVFHKSKI